MSVSQRLILSRVVYKKSVMTSFILAMSLVCLIFFILVFLTNLSVSGLRPTKIYDVSVDEIPPPLPPPPEQPVPVTASNVPNAVIDMIGPSAGPKLEFKLKPKIAFEQNTKIVEPEMQMDFAESFAQLTGNNKLFDVENLDAVPTVIESNNTRIPRNLRKQGIQRIETRVQIIIDTAGKAHIRKIIDPKYEIMQPIIRKHISSVRFTTPTKYGKPVSASYMFLLNFNDFSK